MQTPALITYFTGESPTSTSYLWININHIVYLRDHKYTNGSQYIAGEGLLVVDCLGNEYPLVPESADHLRKILGMLDPT